MMTSQCPRCVRYLGKLTCEAFPKRIPIEILTGKHDHTKPFQKEDELLFLEAGAQKLEKAEELVKFYDFTAPIVESASDTYEQVKKILIKKHGYKAEDFEEDGKLYGWSANELLGLILEEKRSE